VTEIVLGERAPGRRSGASSIFVAFDAARTLLTIARDGPIGERQRAQIGAFYGSGRRASLPA
jgi:hypothetical protein